MKVYSERQMSILQMARYEQLSVQDYVNPEFTEDEMLAVLEGLREGVDVTVYANTSYNYLQMLAIKELLRSGLNDLSMFTPDTTFNKMVSITRFLMDKHNPKPYLEKGLTPIQLDLVRTILNQENSEELLKYAEYSNYNVCVMKSILEMKFVLPDIKELIDSGRLKLCGINGIFAERQSAIIEKAILNGYDILRYATSDMEVNQIKEIVSGLENGIDPECYSLALYNDKQMHFIKTCLIAGRDVTHILKPDLSVMDMEMIVNG